MATTRDNKGRETSVGTMTKPQRGLLFTKMGEVNLSEEELRESLGFHISELSVSEASILIDYFVRGGKSLPATIAEVKAMHAGESPAQNTEQKKQDFFNQEAEAQETEKPQKKEEQKPVIATPHHEVSVRLGDMEISEDSLENLSQIPRMLNKVFANVMQKGTDYATIPGTEKPTLLKPGAELLRQLFGLEFADISIESVVEDWESCRFFYRIKVAFSKNGKVIGSGVGSANTEETRYAIRWVAESKLPAGIDKSTLRKETKTGKYGQYIAYMMPSSKDERATLANTILKMAKKRAFVDGILSITGASRIFTQDVEDF